MVDTLKTMMGLKYLSVNSPDMSEIFRVDEANHAAPLLSNLELLELSSTRFEMDSKMPHPLCRPRMSKGFRNNKLREIGISLLNIHCSKLNGIGRSQDSWLQ